MSETTPRYRWTLVRAGLFKLDAGSMFGLIPRTVWSRGLEVDDKGRMQVQHNCLVLERVGEPGIGHARFALIEAGTGDKLDDKSRDIFALENRCIEQAVREVGYDPSSIGAAVITHLHFDHAGGLTRLCRDGEAPDWTGPAGGMAGSRADHGVKLTFPNAVIYTQKREWEDALANRSLMTRTYFRDHLLPLSQRVVTIDSPAPFAIGRTPDREERPELPFERRESELPNLPGVTVFKVPGHTWGQQAVKFQDEAGRTVVFTPDVMPTVHHLGAAYSLAYDVEPYTSMISRQWFLREAAIGDWLLVLDHEPGNPCQRVTANNKGWFDLHPVTDIRGQLG